MGVIRVVPFYSYICNACNFECEIFHLISEIDIERTCEKCNSGTLIRALSEFNTVRKPLSPSTKVGTVVEEFIKESKKDLQKEKKRLKKDRKDA